MTSRVAALATRHAPSPAAAGIRRIRKGDRAMRTALAVVVLASCVFHTGCGGGAPRGGSAAGRTFITDTGLVTTYEYDDPGLGGLGIPTGGRFLLGDEKTVVGVVRGEKALDKVLIDEDGERRIRMTVLLTPGTTTVGTVVARYTPTGHGAKVRKATLDGRWESDYLYDPGRRLGGVPRVETRDATSQKKVAETRDVKLTGDGRFSGEEVCYDEAGQVVFRSTFVRHVGTGLLVSETVLEGELPRDYHHYELVLQGWPDHR